MKYVKDQIYNTVYSSSTIPKGTVATLGTIEKDACSYYGRHEKKKFRGVDILKYAVENLDFKTALDIGAGSCDQTNYLKSFGKEVYTCDFDKHVGPHCNDEIQDYDFKGDFLSCKINKKFDFVLASHVLEHQRNTGLFLDKVASLVNENGYICIIVPPRKPFIVGGHVSIWNPGLVLYNLIVAGIDCSESYICHIDYDIGIIVKAKKYDNNKINLSYDMGDIDLLKDFFPMDVKEPFNGDIMKLDTIKNKREKNEN